MNCDLSKIPINELTGALLLRIGELFVKNWLIPSAFSLHKVMGPVVCIDGIPWRRNEDGVVELMAMRRRTGPFPGKLVLIGGTIAKGESFKDALQRHFRDDFGIEIKMSDEPLCMTQYRTGEPDNQWLQDPGKDHVVSPVYLIHGISKIPQQSLNGDLVEWFSRDLMPSDSEFGYGTERVYRKAFEAFVL
jgi:ADP-ribose pyrophosphatase YjhB (NUDIX family)